MLRLHCVVSKNCTLCSLLGKLCNSRIKRLSWGFRGNNPFFCSEILINLGLQLYFQSPPLYTRLVRSTLGYSVYMKHSVNFTHHHLILCALGFGAAWCGLTTALSPIVEAALHWSQPSVQHQCRDRMEQLVKLRPAPQYVFMPMFILSVINIYESIISGVCPAHPLPLFNLSCHSFMVCSDAVCFPDGSQGVLAVHCLHWSEGVFMVNSSPRDHNLEIEGCCQQGLRMLRVISYSCDGNGKEMKARPCFGPNSRPTLDALLKRDFSLKSALCRGDLSNSCLRAVICLAEHLQQLYLSSWLRAQKW